jgi:hypothetical protein
MLKRKLQKGVSMVEFALVLPLLVIVIFGIIEFSLILFDKAIITNASREGARTGIVFSVPPVPDSEIIDVIDKYCQNRLISLGSPSAIQPTIIREGIGAPGDSLTVRVDYKYKFLVLPAFITSLAGEMNLRGETVMRME